MSTHSKFQNMKNSQAFTILELSAVLVIIGILILGVIKGAGLVESSRLGSARTLTAKSPVPEIDGLVAWWEASSKDSLKESEAIDAAQISEWRDISPNSLAGQKNKLTRTASSAVVLKSDGINKVPSLQFDGTSNISLSSFYQGPAAQPTVILVFRPNSSVSANVIFDGNSSTSSISLNAASVQLNAGSAATTATANNPAALASGRNYILAAYFNADAGQVFINDATSRIGLDVSDGSPDGILSVGANSLNGDNNGSNIAASSRFTGLISEVIIYNRPLKLQERIDIFQYLSKKYAIKVAGI